MEIPSEDAPMTEAAQPSDTFEILERLAHEVVAFYGRIGQLAGVSTVTAMSAVLAATREGEAQPA